MGVAVSGNAQQLAMLGEQIVAVGNAFPQPVVGRIIAEFGYSFTQPLFNPVVKSTHRFRVSWPRLLYLVHVLQRLAPPLAETIEPDALNSLCQWANETLQAKQPTCYQPINHLAQSSLALYQGDYMEGLLLMTETAFVRHRPVSDRLSFLPTCIDMLSPSAWLHHDTLSFVQSIAHHSWQMHILRSDLAEDFARQKW
jgi:hypothetical protein